MKKSLLVIILAFASFAGAVPIQFENKTLTMEAGLRGVITDSNPTYALSGASATVASAYIDLSATGALYVCVTATANTMAKIAVQYSNTNTAVAFGVSATTAVNSIQQLGIGCYPIQAMARWVRFVNQSTSQTAGVANTVSVNYYVSNAPSTAVTIGQTITVAGTVTANQGTAGSPWPVGVTSTPFTSWQIVSQTTRTISSPTSINLSSAAGSTGIFQYRFQASNSASSGVYWNETANSTWLPPRAFYSVTTTPIQASNIYSGTHLNMSPASATDISATVEVIIKKLIMVVP